MSKARKAITAGFGAAGAALLAGLLTRVPGTAEEWAALIGGSIGAGVLAGVAVYKVKYDGVHDVGA